MKLADVSTSALEQELERRKAGPRPVLDPMPDWSVVVKLFEDHIADISRGDYHEDNDFDHYLYEEVAKALYGEGFFKWFSKAIR